MPWKGVKDPYKIWLSEIILQQTRVQQGLSYYNKFVQTYPHIKKLANAPDEEVFKLWEGLGYYSRCKNLLFTARLIARKHAGIFPTTYGGLLQLKGIGPYTAAAIASFAYNLPYAVLDGNVFRILSRYFGIDTPIDSNEGKKLFNELAQECLPADKAAIYNQAVMDFGATVCTPQIPACHMCPLQAKCVALKKGFVDILPVKEKQLVKKNRCLTYFVFSHKSSILVNQRKGKDIWENLNEFYLFENVPAKLWDEKMVGDWLLQHLGISDYVLNHISGVYKQKLTHQNLTGQFIKVRLNSIPPQLQHFKKIKHTNINQLAFPRFINQYLEQIPL